MARWTFQIFLLLGGVRGAGRGGGGRLFIENPQRGGGVSRAGGGGLSGREVFFVGGGGLVFFPIKMRTFEQHHFYANKAKNRNAPLVSETPQKRDTCL